ncbi:MAG: acyl-CoA carboxylase subunit beta [Candidatus Wallbacteria bacterium]|nr:acyl-CoA carboxylase subunit beta [Candidatus Wallbacteria bacterium]
MNEKLNEFRNQIAALQKKSREVQSKKGKLSANERLARLFDGGEFREINAIAAHNCHDFGMADKKIPGDGVITAYGYVNGRLVYVCAQDFAVMGGSLGRMHATKIIRMLDAARKNGAPAVCLNDSGGARIQEGVHSLAGYAEIFYANTMASGVVPQISVIMGPCAGGAVYSPALTDFVVITRENSFMFLTGPEVVKAVTGEEISFENLGGSVVHSEKSGVAHLVADDDEDAMEIVRKLLSYLPQNNLEDPPYIEYEDDKREFKNPVPDSPEIPYDMHELIAQVFDSDSFFEVQPDFARNLLVGFARLHGFCVGVVANNPKSLAGVLDINSSIKGARFIRFCDSFNIPIISLIDVPGFLPGSSQEHNGVIRNGAKLLYAYCEATVPKIGVIVRKDYGGAYCVMSSKHVGADMNFAWPNAEIAVMGAEGACNIIFKKEISEAKDQAARRRELIEFYKEKFSNPYIAAEWAYIDEVILPEETRERLFDALQASMGKRISNPDKKHGNMPL